MRQCRYVNKSILLSCQICEYVRKNLSSSTSRSKPWYVIMISMGLLTTMKAIKSPNDLTLFFFLTASFFFHLCLNCPVGTFLKSSDVDNGCFSRNKLNACSTVFSVSLIVVIHFHETMSKLSCLLDYTLSVHWYWAFNPDSLNSLVIHTSN